ncbi:Segregation and condensation protein B [hydrothermal vent metagenome]|uniref:Segregation and condensation protein B n=1 Tax=hydrothermal vent metagenome TaxID=652676 RepID=A0A3B0YGE8_9ZZZZ
MEQKKLKNIVEGVLLAAGKPLTLDQILSLFDDFERPEREILKEAITLLQNDFEDRGIELKKIASGYRLQVRPSLSLWVSRLWEDKPSRYSRAFLETLALVAYRQPITRGEIEAVRGVAVSSNIIRTMMERDWVKVVGQRDVPGKPALYATTKSFLDSFNLSSLSELPSLAEIRSLDDINTEIDFEGKQIKHNDPGLHENPQIDLLNIPMDSHTSALLSSEDGRLNVEEEDQSIPDFANANIVKTPINVLLFDESHIANSDVEQTNVDQASADEIAEPKIEPVVLEAELETESEM